MTASYYFASACYIFLFHNLRIFQNLFFFFFLLRIRSQFTEKKNEERSCRSDRDIDSPIRALNLNKKNKKKKSTKNKNYGSLLTK